MSAKFVQIAPDGQGDLFALDDQGVVWRLNPEKHEWRPLLERDAGQGGPLTPLRKTWVKDGEGERRAISLALDVLKDVDRDASVEARVRAALRGVKFVGEAEERVAAGWPGVRNPDLPPRDVVIDELLAKLAEAVRILNGTAAGGCETWLTQARELLRQHGMEEV